jgi:hypothetical protein
VRERHQKPDVEKALRYAEEVGWTVVVKKSKKSHAWGRVVSPVGQVKIRVDGTPSPPGRLAKDVRRAVDRYRRRSGPS